MQPNKKFNYKQAKFHTTVNDLEHLPEESIFELAVCGRSNAGKSTMLNTLTNQTRLAFTSKTPGRTQHINYFSFGVDGLFLVDLPGYGYAKVPAKIRIHWEKLLGHYLQNRKQLLGLVLIMDSRHPLKDLDYTMLEFFGNTGKPIHIILSKSDKLNTQERAAALKFVKTKLTDDGFTNFTVQLFSALKRSGIEEIETALDTWLNAAYAESSENTTTLLEAENTEPTQLIE